ncbi:Protein argonaute MEL1, partial [Zancudomyces culisetae]
MEASEQKPVVTVDFAKRPGFAWDKAVYQYDITIKPKPRPPREGEEPRPVRDKKLPIKLNQDVFSAFLRTYGSSNLGGIFMAYDGAKTAFAKNRLPLADKEQEFEISLISGGRTAYYHVKVMEAAEVPMKSVWDFAKGSNTVETRDWSSALRVLDTLLGQGLENSHVKVGRSYFTSKDSHRLGEGVELWRGVFQSVKAGQGKLYVNVDLAYTGFIMGGSLLSFLGSIFNIRDPRDLSRIRPEEICSRANKMLRGATMKMSHMTQKSRRFKAKELDAKGADERFFDFVDREKNTTERISVKDYFRNRYNIRLEFPSLPCVVFGPGNYLPVELCEIDPGQNYKKKLNETQTAEVIKQACIKPNQRMAKIEQSYRDLRYSENKAMREFDFRVSDKLVRTEARQLQTPTLCYSDRSRGGGQMVPRGGAWNMRDKV